MRRHLVVHFAAFAALGLAACGSEDAFEALVRRARERLYGTAVDAATDSAAVELAKDPSTR